MTSVVALDRLLDTRRVWRGQAVVSLSTTQPTGPPELDAVLPGGGWPESALSELLVATTGIGELRLLWPTLARLTSAGERVILVDPPHLPYPQGLAGGRNRSVPLVHRPSDRSRHALGRRTMPALGQLRCCAVLAEACR